MYSKFDDIKFGAVFSDLFQVSPIKVNGKDCAPFCYIILFYLVHGGDNLSLTAKDGEVLFKISFAESSCKFAEEITAEMDLQLILEHNAGKMQSVVTIDEEMCTCELESIQLVKQERSITIGFKKVYKFT